MVIIGYECYDRQAAAGGNRIYLVRSGSVQCNNNNNNALCCNADLQWQCFSFVNRCAFRV